MAEQRLQPLDALRGFIMIVMALDHASLFIAHVHPRPEFWSGSFPVYTEALAFLTRFVTHLAAPGFFFLMGAAITLFANAHRERGWTETALTQHFIARGLLLVALQFVLENAAWQIGAILTGGGSLLPVYFGVLYGLGGAMFLAAFLRRAPPSLLAVLSLTLLLLPEVLIRSDFPLDFLSPLIGPLLIPLATGWATIYYPILPWLGLAGLGLLFGRLLLQDRQRTYQRSAVAGVALLALFVVVRALDGFGNIRPAAGPGWINFLNVVKYPPSLAFVLLTLGANLLLLSLFSRLESWTKPLVVFGRSPLFFYIAHLYLYGLLGFFFFPEGTGILKMYPIWLIGLAILYFLCLGYGRFKSRQAPDSLWRFA